MFRETNMKVVSIVRKWPEQRWECRIFRFTVDGEKDDDEARNIVCSFSVQDGCFNKYVLEIFSNGRMVLYEGMIRFKRKRVVLLSF